jgi:hypothetical protein
VEIGTEVAQFPEKEYINGIFVAVYDQTSIEVEVGGEGHCGPLTERRNLFLRVNILYDAARTLLDVSDISKVQRD